MAETPQDAMSPEEMAQMQSSAGKGGGDITKLAQQVAQGLQQLAQAIESSDATTDEDKSAIGDIMAQFVDLVENKLGSQGPGEDQEQENPELSQMPAMQGRTGVPMGPQTRQ